MVRTGPPLKPPGRDIERQVRQVPPRNRKPEPESEEEESRGSKLKREATSFMFDIIAAFIVLLLLVGGIYNYTDNWPPIVVVQSGSMQHSDDTSFVGVIDTGDLVFVKKVDAENEVIPYLKGMDKDHRTYDSYGDVIIFRPNGNEDRTAIIHRSVVYLEFNYTDWDPENGSYGGFDIPHTGEENLKGNYLIEGYEWPEGTSDNGLYIDFNEILKNFDIYDVEPHGGFITKGDDNPGVDQTSDFFSNDPPWIEPVEPDWVIGKSVGELPWFGIIKLRLEGNDNWPDNSGKNLLIAIIVLIATPFILDIGIHMIVKTLKPEQKEEEEEDEPERKRRRPPGNRLKAEVRRPPRERRPPPRFKP